MKTVILILLSVIFYYSGYAQVIAKPKTTTNKSAVAAPKPTTSTAAAKAPENDFEPIVAEPGKDIIAIYPFTTARGYDYEYAQSVGNAVEAGFVKSNRFTVVERSRFGAINSEERFQEVNTAMVVKAASKFGATYIVSGHITGANTGKLYDKDGKFDGYQTSISVTFKIIEVATGQIKITESISLSGTGGSTATSIGSAYASIDGVTRRVIAFYFPQRFQFMAILAKDVKKKEEVLASFKIWGGSDNGLKAGDMVEVYVISEIINPTTKKTVIEKQLVGAAQISEVNSGTTATCLVYKPRKYGKTMLDLVSATPDKVAIEYTGGERPVSFWESL